MSRNRKGAGQTDPRHGRRSFTLAMVLTDMGIVAVPTALLASVMSQVTSLEEERETS